MGGVPNVISTSWTVFDDACVEAAKGFYDGLIAKEGSAIDIRRCAESLSNVTGRMRDKGRSPLVWAAYTHFGV